jgi:DNA-binding PadR family transcriptional regulator
MEYVILGLLALRAMTVYEINKALERGVAFACLARCTHGGRITVIITW